MVFVFDEVSKADSLLFLHMVAGVFGDGSHWKTQHGISFNIVRAFNAMKDSVESWGKLLIATGGTLKPVKCFLHLISFDWDKKESGPIPNTRKMRVQL